MIDLLQMKKQNHCVSPVRVMDLRGTYKGGGGPDKTILLSAKHHNPERVDVLVTYLRDPRDDEFEIDKKAAELMINYVDVSDKYLLDLKCVRQLHLLIKKFRISLLHAHDDKTLLYGWFLKQINPHLHIMYTCHSYANYTREDFKSNLEYLNHIVRDRIRIFLMKKYSKPILTISEDTKKRLIKSDLKKENISVLPNGIDCDYWKRENGRSVLKDELSLRPDEYLVGTVARIAYDKDLPTFFKVAQAVVKKMPNVKFVIVGDGYGDELLHAKKIVDELALNMHVYFTGHRNDLLDIYPSFDLFLMTSLSEGMPNTVLEAMAMGIPVVATNVGGVPELVVHGETGALAETGEYIRLVRYVLMLLRDNVVSGEFSIKSRDRILNKFSFKKRVEILEGLYVFKRVLKYY